MAPLIPQGCFILITSLLRFFSVKPGQRLLIKHPEYGVIVKTVAYVDHNGLIWSRGENAGSVSVEQIGPISKDQILGRVIRIFKPRESVSQSF